MQDSNNKTLGLFFSYGVGLGTWEKQGYLNREIKYYTKLAETLGRPACRAGRVSFFTYDRFSGTGADPVPNGTGSAPVPANVFTCTRSALVPNWLYVFLMPFLQAKAIQKCDILKTNQMSGALPAVIAKIIYRKKLVVRCGYEWLYSLVKAKKPLWKRAFVYCLSALAYKTADKIIFTSKPDKDFAQKKFKIQEGKIAIIPNYIDTDLFKPLPEVAKEPNSVCFVGRLSPEKNLKELIAAVNELPQAKLYIAGEGLEKQALQEQAKNNKNIVFLGQVPNEQLPVLLNKCEIFALPSFYEGNPKALLEAMACGLPCIASDIDGIREIIKNNHNGLLMRPGKEKELRYLQLQVAELLANKPLAEKFGNAARQSIVSRFSLETILCQEKKLY